MERPLTQWSLVRDLTRTVYGVTSLALQTTSLLPSGVLPTLNYFLGSTAEDAVCGERCVTAADCDSSSYCANEICVALKGVTRSCSLSYECLSGVCTQGVCALLFVRLRQLLASVGSARRC